jgi:hypothetical protein
MVFSDHSACDITQFNLTSIGPISASNPILGYYVDSTAPINVEDQPMLPTTSVLAKIQDIARYLIASDDPQIVIAIHGYGTQRSDAEERYRKIYQYAGQLCQPNSSVFFGYHWPSEKPSGDPSIPGEGFSTKLQNAFQALPILPKSIFWIGLILSIIATLITLVVESLNGWLIPILVISVSAFSILLCLILLRLSTYFRDQYRATNYGVLDLVELIRQLDQAVTEMDSEGTITRGPKKIKLSFLGHSMGCFVVTNTIRILSDVFNPWAVEKRPLSNIGRVFSLERLILVAPDIPIETVIPRRANFLRSSLRRCQEAYVFANEGDLAVRLASTAANYFSFPGKTRFSGYRLGNLTAKRFRNQSDRNNRQLGEKDYGIVNLSGDRVEPPYHCLEIRSSDQEHKALYEIRDLAEIEKENLENMQETPVSDLFTYFDCTDYIDVVGAPDGTWQRGSTQGVVSYARRKSALNLQDYASLCFAFFLGWPRSINVHGGYFDGVLSQQLMYKLAFLGFGGLLTSSTLEPSSETTRFKSLSSDTKKVLLDQLSQQCQKQQIQVVLAPIRYQQDILQ